MLERGEPLYQKWQLIPDNTDVLITHGPPRGIGDEATLGFRCFNAGCIDLLHRIDQLSLKAHVFGHIHEGYGEYARGPKRLINASICTVRYKPINPPIVLDLDV